MNHFGKLGKPFIFILDFELVKPIVIPLHEIDPTKVLYKVQGIKNYSLHGQKAKPLQFDFSPIEKNFFYTCFDEVLYQINKGNSYLLNLTFPGKLDCNYTLKELFEVAQAKYKLYFNDEFIFFSPETFVVIQDNTIRTFPMKGTIDAAEPNAAQKILADEKETAEHYTIVDLLRNDLSTVATNVRVEKFRYIDKIKTSSKTLLQVSSEIVGDLFNDYPQYLGDIFKVLLPAGSISGAPKKKTIEIIQNVETDLRGYYTGVFGLFDGKNVDSAVMIRYIEKRNDQLFYRSGVGITSKSNCAAEYQELIDKAYVPVSRKY